MGSSKKGGPLRRLVRPRLYQQLADHISDFIEAQGLAPGDRLPPERELAMELGVSRATLAQALVALEVAGRVEVRHGDGAVVQEARGSARLDAVVAHYPLSQLTAARAALLRGVVADSPEAAGSLRLGDETDSTEVIARLRQIVGPGLIADLDTALAAAGATVRTKDLQAAARDSA